MSEAGGQSIIYVRRARSRYVVARDHPAPERVRAHLDDAARADLAGRLRAAFAGLAPGESSLWFIRRLEISFALNASASADRIATAWASQIAGAVKTVMVGGPDGEGVVHFANRAEYLGRFLVESAMGTAWSRWYFSRFAGLRALPASSVIRSAIVADPTVALAALLAMTTGDQTLVIETLSPMDALRAASGLACGTGADAALARNDARRALATVRSSGARVSCEERLVLRACAECAHTGPPPNHEHLAACRALVRLATMLSGISPTRAAALLEALTSNAVATTIRLTSIADAEVLSALSSAPKTWLASVGNELTPAQSGASSSMKPDAGPRDTLFGSLFLLLPQLVSLPLDSLVSAWPDCDGTPASEIVRFLVALAAGSGNVWRDWYDPVARDVMGITPSLSVERVRAWSAEISGDIWSRLKDDIGGEQLAASDDDFLTLPSAMIGGDEAVSAVAAIGNQVLRHFAAMLPGFSQSSALHLFINFLDVRASLEDEPTRRVVRLGRPPLDLVLRMAGIGGGVIVLPWLDSRAFTLFPEERA